MDEIPRKWRLQINRKRFPRKERQNKVKYQNFLPEIMSFLVWLYFWHLQVHYKSQIMLQKGRVKIFLFEKLFINRKSSMMSIEKISSVIFSFSS